MMNSLDNGLLRPYKPYLAHRPFGIEWLGRLHGWSSRRLLW